MGSEVIKSYLVAAGYHSWLLSLRRRCRFFPIVLDIVLWVHSIWINTEHRVITFYLCRIYD